LAWLFFLGFLAGLIGLTCAVRYLSKNPEAYAEQKDSEVVGSKV
jgi:hypothetical protein